MTGDDLPPPAGFAAPTAQPRKAKPTRIAGWEVVRPVRVRPRPAGVYWARAGQINTKGFGGRLCQDDAHGVYPGRRTDDEGRQTEFWLCATCNPVEEG